jgi:hypothetical protein
MDEYNRDATWKIIGKGAAQLLMSERCVRVHELCLSSPGRVRWSPHALRERGREQGVGQAHGAPPPGRCLVPPAYASEPYGTGSLLECLNRHGTAHATAQASPAESPAHPVAQVPMFQSLGCMQRLLLEGGMNLDFQDGCVPAPGCPKFGCFSSSKSPCLLVAVGSRTRSPFDLAFPRRHVRRAVCTSTASIPGTPAAGRSKNKKEPRATRWAARRLLHGHRLQRCRGHPLGHTDPSPAVAWLREGRTALHWAAFYGHRRSVRALVHAGAHGYSEYSHRATSVRRCAHGHQRSVRARIHAGAPLHIKTTGNGLSGRWDSRLGGSARSKRCGRGGPVLLPLPAGSARRCTMLPAMAAPPQRPRCSAPARTYPSRTNTGTLRRAAPRRTADCHQPQCAQGDGRASRTLHERNVRVGGGAGALKAAPLAAASPTPACGRAPLLCSHSAR